MAVAASVLCAVVMLGVTQARQSAHRVACASNLMNISTAFATYASTNHDQLPELPPSPDRNWLRPSPAYAGSHTNTDNLLPLMNASLIRPANFLCPGRATTAGPDMRADIPTPTCSPQIIPSGITPTPPSSSATATPSSIPPPPSIRNPTPPITASTETILRADGAVTWETSPNVGLAGDNIWTIGTGPQYQTAFAGTELARPGDTFLSP